VLKKKGKNCVFLDLSVEEKLRTERVDGLSRRCKVATREGIAILVLLSVAKNHFHREGKNKETLELEGGNERTRQPQRTPTVFSEK